MGARNGAPDAGESSNPWHPSNYNSDFEQMDAEYPAQSGMFNKQANMAYPGWMPVGKYKAVSPPQGASVGCSQRNSGPGFSRLSGDQSLADVRRTAALLFDQRAPSHPWG